MRSLVEIGRVVAPGRIDVAVEGGVAHVTLNNPARKNAVSAAMWGQLARISADLSDLPELRVVVVRGYGDEAFSTGADISEFAESRRTAELADEYTALSEAATDAVAAIPVPVIALVHGFCLGAGSAIALSCDLRYLDDRAKVGIPAARLGVGYELGWVRRLVESLGAEAASRILFTARQFTASEALELRFASSVQSASDLDGHVASVVREIAQNAPLTLKSAKLAIRAAVGNRVEDWEKAAQSVRVCSESRDYFHAVDAFAKREKPVFEGR